MARRLVLCCDGTWNTPDQAHGGTPCPTNVAKLAMGVARTGPDGREQCVYYQPGVGTRPGERLRGGALGVGLSRNVQDAYRFLVENYEPGDELFLLGFSRGAYVARSTVGLLRNCGVLERDHARRIEEAYRLYRSRRFHPKDLEAELFRRTFSHQPRVRFLGVWDTVGSLGIPSLGFGLAERVNRPWQFHDTELSSWVEAGFQALAVDERRRPFAPAVWTTDREVPGQQVEQVWFSGAHCDVGGGNPDSALSDIALLWMVERARACGLAFRDDAFLPAPRGERADPRELRVTPDPAGRMHDSRRGLYRLLPPYHRPLGRARGGHESVASSAVERYRRDDGYRPPGLAAHLRGRHWVTDVPTGARREQHGLSA